MLFIAAVIPTLRQGPASCRLLNLIMYAACACYAAGAVVSSIFKGHVHGDLFLIISVSKVRMMLMVSYSRFCKL
jgi:hypothetical protein